MVQAFLLWQVQVSALGGCDSPHPPSTSPVRGQQFSLWPHFSHGYIKNFWFFCLISILFVRMELLLLSRFSRVQLCNPIDGSPPGFPVPRILQARTMEWVAISFSNAWKWKVKVKVLSRVQLLATPWTAAYQAPPSMGFSRQEYWSGLPLPSPVTSKLLTCGPRSWKSIL